MRRRNEQGIGEWERVELSALNQSLHSRRGSLHVLSRHQPYNHQYRFGNDSGQLQNAALWFRWRGVVVLSTTQVFSLQMIVVCHVKTIPARLFWQGLVHPDLTGPCPKLALHQCKTINPWFMTCIYHWNSVLFAELVWSVVDLEKYGGRNVYIYACLPDICAVSTIYTPQDFLLLYFSMKASSEIQTVQYWGLSVRSIHDRNTRFTIGHLTCQTTLPIEPIHWHEPRSMSRRHSHMSFV